MMQDKEEQQDRQKAHTDGEGKKQADTHTHKEDRLGD
jgi:hypothetical protein